MKFLVDECLGPELTLMVRSRGHDESSHVVWLGKGGIKDWELMRIVLAGDWTLVTKNSYDFRGPADAPGSKGEFKKVELHAGLVCLNGPPAMDPEMQISLFATILDELEDDDDLINAVLEATLSEGDFEEIVIQRYALPEWHAGQIPILSSDRRGLPTFRSHRRPRAQRCGVGRL
jgi:predicted nuclease of predicted toxin-antitoxin system